MGSHVGMGVSFESTVKLRVSEILLEQKRCGEQFWMGMYEVRDVTCNRQGLGLNGGVVLPVTYLSLISDRELLLEKSEKGGEN